MTIRTGDLLLTYDTTGERENKDSVAQPFLRMDERGIEPEMRLTQTGQLAKTDPSTRP